MVYTNCLYQEWTKITLSILHIEKASIYHIDICLVYNMYRKMSICNINKYPIVYTWYRQFVYTIYIQKYLCINYITEFFYTEYGQNIIVYIPYIQYIIKINRNHYLYTYEYLNNKQNSILTLINFVYINSEYLLWFYRFSKC